MHITIVNGTARIDNRSQHVATALANQLAQRDVTSQLVAVGDHVAQAVTTPPWGAGGANTNPTAWQRIVAETDRFVFVLPEYNHSFPGEWKLLMDSLYAEYAGKTAYVVAVSNGQFAGTRVMEHVLPVLINFKFVVAQARLHIARVNETVATDGTVTDEQTQQRVEKFVDALVAR